MSRGQLGQSGVSGAQLSRWATEGTLHRIYPGVYAVGHSALATRGRLTAALLYAGEAAMLSHATAAWWWGLLDDEPRWIHVSTPTRCRSVANLTVHGRRALAPVVHAGLPITSVPQTVLDLATVLRPPALRRVLAEVEYRRLANLDAVDAMARPGVRGSAALRAALARHRPELALSRSALEEGFIALCEAYAIPLPHVNAKLCGLTVDALWEERRLVVELDGHAAHATPAAVERDRRRDLRLRTAGYLGLRYTWQQITDQPEAVAADLRQALATGR